MKPVTAGFLVLGVSVLAGLFLLFRPATPPATPPTPIATPRVFELRVEHGRLVSGPAVIQVGQGEQVTLQVTSDHADELHLHGYDLQLALPAGQAARLSLTAERSGRFEYELHHAHRELGVLEVRPR
ncbi:MAG: hypothetical protein ACRESV_02520 [Nevskiales bacterium]